MNWSEHFYLAGDSPSGLRWAREVRCGNRLNRVLHSIGDVAGNVNGTGYFVVAVHGTSHYCHRIIWELFHGAIPDNFDIDHEDGVRTNNTVNNLRCVTHAVNMRNQVNRVPSHEVLGVGRHILRRADGSEAHYWRARWKDLNGQEKGRMFNIIKYGEEEAKALALSTRAKAIQSLNAQSANYTGVHQ